MKRGMRMRRESEKKWHGKSGAREREMSCQATYDVRRCSIFVLMTEWAPTSFASVSAGDRTNYLGSYYSEIIIFPDKLQKDIFCHQLFVILVLQKWSEGCCCRQFVAHENGLDDKNHAERPGGNGTRCSSLTHTVVARLPDRYVRAADNVQDRIVS